MSEDKLKTVILAMKPVRHGLLKRRAREMGVPLYALVDQAIEEWLARSVKKRRAPEDMIGPAIDKSYWRAARLRANPDLQSNKEALRVDIPGKVKRDFSNLASLRKLTYSQLLTKLVNDDNAKLERKRQRDWEISQGKRKPPGRPKGWKQAQEEKEAAERKEAIAYALAHPTVYGK